MKYGSKEVLDLQVFDKDGKYITKIDTAVTSKFKVYYDKTKNKRVCEILVKDALLNFDLLEFINDYKEDTKSDFQKVLSQMQTKSLSFKEKIISKECKLIAQLVMVNQETGERVEPRIKAEKAFISDDFQINGDSIQSYDFDLKFEIMADSDGVLADFIF